MDHFYFIRHGETVWNVENKICGATDIELTLRGHEQAIETGKKILDAGITADVILTSPLVRAKETALAAGFELILDRPFLFILTGPDSLPLYAGIVREP